jgi:hypothetical protein
MTRLFIPLAFVRSIPILRGVICRAAYSQHSKQSMYTVCVYIILRTAEVKVALTRSTHQCQARLTAVTGSCLPRFLVSVPYFGPHFLGRLMARFFSTQR